MSLNTFAFGAGRINRRAFWLWHTLLLACGLVASVGIIFLLGWGVEALAPRAIFLVVWAVLGWLWAAQAVRRLHDFGRPAALVLAPLMLWVGLFAGAFLAPQWMVPNPEGWARIAFLVSAALTSLGLASLIWVGLSKGDHGENRFGPPTWIKHPDPPGMHPGDEALPKREAPPK